MIKADQIFYIITIIGIVGAVIEHIVTNNNKENKTSNSSKESIAIFI